MNKGLKKDLHYWQQLENLQYLSLLQCSSRGGICVPQLSAHASFQRGGMPLNGSAGNRVSGEEPAHRVCALLFFFVKSWKTGLKETLGDHLFPIFV